jgi:cysteine desulfurase
MRVSDTIYLDHQASTPVDPRVINEMAPYHSVDFSNPHSLGHSGGWKAASAVDSSAENVAALIGADSDEIVFTSGATEANNLALLGLGRGNYGGNRRRLLVGSTEHKCVLEATRTLGIQNGFIVEEIPVDQNGLIDLHFLQSSIAEDVLLVSVGAVNSEIGTVQPIEMVAHIAHEHGAVFHCDAAQAPLEYSAQKYGDFVDLLSLSAHKFYGPKGIGALFIRRDLKARIEPLVYGGGQQDGLRSGTLSTPLCVGMGAAAKILLLPEERKRRDEQIRVRNRFIELLKAGPFQVILNGPGIDERHPGNANIQFVGIDARELLTVLQPRISASMGSACASGVPEPSYVLRAIGLSGDEANASIRFSVGYDSVEKDVFDAVEIIFEALGQMADDLSLEMAV